MREARGSEEPRERIVTIVTASRGAPKGTATLSLLGDDHFPGVVTTIVTHRHRHHTRERSASHCITPTPHHPKAYLRNAKILLAGTSSGATYEGASSLPARGTEPKVCAPRESKGWLFLCPWYVLPRPRVSLVAARPPSVDSNVMASSPQPAIVLARVASLRRTSKPFAASSTPTVVHRRRLRDLASKGRLSP